MIKAVLFDAYGTLLSTGNGSVEAAKHILALNGRSELSPTGFYAHWKRLHRSHIDSLASFVPEETVFLMDLRELYRCYGMTRDAGEDVRIMLDTLGRRTAFPEAREVLDELAGGFLTAVASTSDTAPLLRDLERNGLEVRHVFTSESLRVYKPRKAFYTAILRELRILPSEAVFAGDSLTDDVRGPQEAGIAACWVNRKGAKAGTAVPCFEIPDLRPLPETVRMLSRNG